VIGALGRIGDARAAGRRRALVAGALSAAERLKAEPTSALREAAHALRWQARSAAPSDDLIVRGFALVREAARRVHGQAHYPTQLEAGVVLASGGLAEMQTGEGKTLAALLPAFVYALAGRGCHVVTANDYLAQRDARFAGAAFDALRLTVGCATGDLPYDQRHGEYACDVTYGAAREFGFDFLRDRLAGDPERRQQRGRYCALVDEADSVLVDDARTPLVIALGGEISNEEAEFSAWCHRAAETLDGACDMSIDRARRSIRLTQQGCQRVVGLARPPAWKAEGLDRVFHQVEQSLAARLLLYKDRDYIIDAEGVGIVDPSTGRVAAGRKWRDGLQQAVEIKEGLKPTAATTLAARVSLQSFFRGYSFLAGMTGTASACAREFQRVYGTVVAEIPTRTACRRSGLSPRIFATAGAKARAVAAEINARLAAGQAVLVGTPSVESSELLSTSLNDHGIEHVVLNCRRHELEAAIVAQAGQTGRVTIATNMAGRGTDIVVSPEVLAVGGLHVIATEMHASSRIDRQLVGRTARQGDPGSYQFFLSLDDELLAGCQDRAFLRSKRKAQQSPEAELPVSWLHWFRRAQRRWERMHRQERGELLRQERERQKICSDSGLDALLESVE
jgi:preprotein translocase subunit SecA